MPSQSRSARQLPRKRGSQNETFRLLPPTRAGEVARRAGEGNNKQCGGRFLRTSPRRGTLSFVTQKFFCFGAINNNSPRRGTLSFVTQKFFCFGAINNRRNNWCVTPFCRHMKRVEHLNQQGLMPASSLYQSRYGAAGTVISTVSIKRERC